MTIHLKTTRAMKRKAKPVERADKRMGIETEATKKTRLRIKRELLEVIRYFFEKDRKATMLFFAGWKRTDLGLWMKRTKWDGGSVTETYNLNTAYEKQFGPGENNL